MSEDVEYVKPSGTQFSRPARELRRERDPQPTRMSRAQTRLEDILEQGESDLREARDLIVPALEDLSLILQPQHPNLAVLVAQQIEQVIQFRATSSKVSR